MENQSFSLIDIEANEWLDFLATCEEATAFHHPQWLLNLCESYHFRPLVAVMKNDQGQVVSGIPIAEINSPITGKRWVSLPYTDYCYPLSKTDQGVEALTDQLINLYLSKQAPKIELRWEYPTYPGLDKNIGNVLHTAALPEDSEEYFNNLPRKLRKYIRSSSNRGVSIQMGTSLEFMRAFYIHQVSTRKRHGVPVQPWRYFELMQKNILDQGLGFVMLAYSNNHECIAGLVALHWKNTLTLKYGASMNSELVNELRPNQLLDWEAIKWGCDNGFNKLDVGRSDLNNNGLREYKNKWGYVENNLTYSTIGYSKSIHSGTGMGEISRLIIRHSPSLVCRLSGELLYKHFS